MASEPCSYCVLNPSSPYAWTPFQAWKPHWSSVAASLDFKVNFRAGTWCLWTTRGSLWCSAINVCSHVWCWIVCVLLSFIFPVNFLAAAWTLGRCGWRSSVIHSWAHAPAWCWTVWWAVTLWAGATFLGKSFLVLVRKYDDVWAGSLTSGLFQRKWSFFFFFLIIKMGA